MDWEMTTKEAAADLSRPVGFTFDARIMYGLRSARRGPVAEKRGSRLVYRKSTLDAFLRENGSDITAWTEGMWRDVAGDLRANLRSAPRPPFGKLTETLEGRDRTGRRVNGTVDDQSQMVRLPPRQR